MHTTCMLIFGGLCHINNNHNIVCLFLVSTHSRHVAEPAVTWIRIGRSVPGRPVAVDAVRARLAASPARAVPLRSARLRSRPAHAHATGRRLEITG